MKSFSVTQHLGRTVSKYTSGLDLTFAVKTREYCTIVIFTGQVSL